MSGPVVLPPCRTRWRDLEAHDRAWHACFHNDVIHTYPHECGCGASCPVLGLTPPSLEEL